MRKLLRRFFPQLAFRLRYRGAPPWDSGISPPELIAFIEAHPAGRALDLGCGTGTNAVTLAQHGWQVTGIDFVAKAVGQGREKAQTAGVEVDLRVADLTRLEDLVDRFDLILDMGCHHSLPYTKRPAYRRNLARWLAPEGSYLLYAFLSERQVIPGFTPADIDDLSTIFHLEKRVDGWDRGERPSAWFWFSAVSGGTG